MYVYDYEVYDEEIDNYLPICCSRGINTVLYIFLTFRLKFIFYQRPPNFARLQFSNKENLNWTKKNNIETLFWQLPTQQKEKADWSSRSRIFHLAHLGINFHYNEITSVYVRSRSIFSFLL